MKKLIIISCIFLVAFNVRATSKSETTSSAITITKKNFEQELLVMEHIFSPLGEARKETFSIYPVWEESEWANAMARRWPGDAHIIVYGGLARRAEFTTDTLALAVCHETGHLYGGEPLSDPDNFKSAEGQADYWAGQFCLPKSLKQFDFLDDPTPARETIVELCQSHPEINLALCLRSLKAMERLGSFFAHNAQVPPPNFETPDKNVVKETSLEYSSPQCRLDTFLAGFFGKDRPRCWFLFAQKLKSDYP